MHCTYKRCGWMWIVYLPYLCSVHIAESAPTQDSFFASAMCTGRQTLQTTTTVRVVILTAGGIKLEFHGTDTDTDTDVRDATIV